MERLTSWKEIADYLGVTVRTAQNWERERGLPIQRAPGGRSQVSALISEIDAWRQCPVLENHVASVEHVESDATSPAELVAIELVQPPAPASSRRQWVTGTGILALVLVIAAVTYVARTQARRNPALFRIEQNVLVVLDVQGREIWRHAFPADINGAVETSPSRYFWTGDLDGDGDTEVLFVHQPAARGIGDAVVYCFSRDGRVRWTFTPGRTVRTQTEEFAPPYHVHQIAVVPHRGKSYIAVSAYHHLYHPNQIAVLTPAGKMVREYWHSGTLRHMAAGDLNRDGAPELYVGGVNNGSKAATLIVLDLEGPSGVSKEPNPAYQLLDLPVVHERARAVLPRTCINRTLEPYNQVSDLYVNGSSVTVHVKEAMAQDVPFETIYEFGPSGQVLTATPNDAFWAFHKQMELEKQLNHSITRAELSEFRNIHWLTPPPRTTAQIASRTDGR
ncbi:MAG TPA: hypothetical protein VD837_02655 [Terriglobales bacterium]|nr:hypothetical protein [Terriglobales bacterium]